MARIQVKPTEGRRIRDEKTGAVLPADEATEVESSIYWHRLAKAGDIEVGPFKASPSKATKTATRASSSSEES